jgi:hypothetical protein
MDEMDETDVYMDVKGYSVYKWRLMPFLRRLGSCLGTDLHQRCMDSSFSSVHILDDTRSYMTTMQCLLLS